MAKKFTKSSEQLTADPKYKSKLVSKFVNCLMWGGKKSIAQRIFYDAMDIIEQKIQTSKFGDRDSSGPAPGSALEVFEAAINNVKPLIEVRSKRVGGSSYQVPMQVNAKRQQSLAFRWLIHSARAKKGKPMCQHLAVEMIDAFHKRGNAMTTRENIHRMAEANKAFAHFAW